ncbi:MAG TPA: hypothetical protein VGG32_10940 [Thermoplasmata archaeon]
MVVRRWSVGNRDTPFSGGRRAIVFLLIAVAVLPIPGGRSPLPPTPGVRTFATPPSTPVSNFSASINRLVELVALAGSGILSLVWARVALSWFSNDITKKIQAKDRARDALVGTLLFMAAVTGLLYGLAHWVLTGS